MTRPGAPPEGSWTKVRQTGSFAPNAVTFLGYEPTDADAGVWSRPAQTWVEGGTLSSARWRTAGILETWELVDVELTHRVPVPKPRVSLFDAFLHLESEADVARLAARVGPLGRCGCSWSGEPSTWAQNLHDAHEQQTSRPSFDEYVMIRTYESVDTWYQVRDRLAAFISLFGGAGGTTDDPDAAATFGLVWPAREQELSTWVRRRNVVTAMNVLARAADLRPRYDWTNERGLTAEVGGAGFLGWLVTHAFRTTGVGEPRRQCRGCGEWFQYGRRRVWCDRCGTRAAWRAASRGRRDKLKGIGRDLSARVPDTPDVGH